MSTASRTARALFCVVLLGAVAACADGARPLAEELARVAPPRSISPRLSIPLGYRPCPVQLVPDGTVPRAECPAPSGAADAGAVAARALDSLRAGADPALMHAVGMNELLWARGAGNRLHQSIWYLEAAARLSDRPAPVLADLAAAYLVRAERTQAPRDLLLALETASRALELAPDDAAALYNRALALDRFGLADEAVEGWRRFLAVDGASGWADEARARVAALTTVPPEPVPPRPGAPARELAAFAARTPQGAGEHGWTVALGEWGAAVERGDAAGAAGWLAVADELGTALERAGRDASLAGAVRAIRGRAGDARGTRALAGGHRAYAGARVLFDAGQYEAAGQALRGVLRDGTASPTLGLWVRHLDGALRLLAGDNTTPAALHDLLAETDTLRYPSIAGKAGVSLGTWHLRREPSGQARNLFRVAARHHERAGNGELLGGTWYLLADAEFVAGDERAAYTSAHRGVMLLRAHRGSVWLHTLLSVVGEEAGNAGMLRAAVVLQREGVRVAERSGRPELVAEARAWLAQSHAALGEAAAAEVEFRTAAEGLARHSDGSAGSWLAEDLRLARAQVLLSTEPARAATVLDSVVTASADVQSAPRRMRALAAGVEARLAAGDEAGALTTAERAARLLEEGDRFALRSALRHGGGEVFDRLVMLHLARGDTTGALAVLERGRNALAFAGRYRGGDGRWLVPTGSVALSYALIGDTLLAWTVRDRRTALTRSTVNRAALVRTLERTRESLELGADGPSVRADLAALYDWLVRPLAARLGPTETPLLIAADGEIAAAPFAALWDGRRFLVERHPLRWVASLRDATLPPAQGSPGAALLVANPAFDAAAHPGLGRLPGARAEAAEVAALYPRSSLLADDAASRRAVARALGEMPVVHVAGHAVFDDERPERSYLVLAGGDGSRLTAAEIERMRLGSVRLVVLSACRTLRSVRGRSGGFAGLAGAWLAAGAGGVVGSGWRVGDEPTRVLMTEFHREYTRSGDAARALRAAQRRLLALPQPALRSPAAWAGFRYVGR